MKQPFSGFACEALFWTSYPPDDILPANGKEFRMAKPRRRRKIGSKKRKARRDRRKR
jgi:hypothetical protein